MSTTETKPVQQHKYEWVDYMLMFVFIIVLNKKYPARSQEPVHRATMAIVYMLKTPVQALSVYLLMEYGFHGYILNRFKIFLLVAVAVYFWEFIFHRAFHINKHVLALLKRRHTRRHTQAFMKAYPTLGSTLVWVNFLLVVCYLCFFGIYMALVIITPVPRGY